MATCYRHPDRETGLSCSVCARPICPDCMTQAPVGIRCPECAGKSRAVAAGFSLPNQPVLTYALIAVNVALFLVTNSMGYGSSVNDLGYDLAVRGPQVADGDYYRLVSNAFLHFGLLHLLFNMWALWILGTALESYIGSVRFGAIYLVSALCGSFGALLLSPNAYTGGASGAIFGLMGAMFVLERQRGVSLLGGPVGIWLGLNLVFTLIGSTAGISVGGHLGGLAGGVLAALVLSGFGRGHMAYGRISPLAAVLLLGLGAAAVAGSLAVAGA